MNLRYLLIPLVFLAGCRPAEKDFDASGSFESDEVIVSSQITGQILSLPLHEGDRLSAGADVGRIDATTASLQKAQVQASIGTLRQKTADVNPQLALIRRQLTVQEAQLAQQRREKQRLTNLVGANAAPRKQLDDITAVVDQLEKQLDVTRQQLQVTQTSVATQNRGILSEQAPLEKSVAQLEDQIRKGHVINPVSGTVLTQYAYQGEFATVGKPLYKIANVDTLTLRAYVSGEQLPLLKLGQPVRVRVDHGKDAFKDYTGTLYWIASQAEFTPKTIQTKDERANLVYAVKVRVKNDGYLKIGMYGEMSLRQP